MIQFPEFHSFPKTPRLFRECVVTEKIDGTNASVWIHNGEVRAGSRNRFITPENDNFGFAKWVQENREELLKLGDGAHFGEWWGKGIQRGYGLDHRRFSLFNTSRWNAENVPSCCHVVPVVYKGLFYSELLEELLDAKPPIKSFASPGYDNPEGVMLYHVAANRYFKFTFDGDGHKT